MTYDINFHNLKKDINSGKQLVLFLGAGVNFSKDVKLLWEDLINPLMEISLMKIASDKGMDRQELLDLYDVFEIDSSENLDKEKGYHKVKMSVAYEYSPQIKAMLVKSILKDQYIASFQRQIYSQCNRTVLREAFENSYKLEENEPFKKEGDFYSLYSVARMILLNPHVRAVVTYNYDNFLTHAIRILQSDIGYYFSKKEQAFLKERYRRQGDKEIKIVDIYGEAKPNFFETGTVFVYHPHGYIPSPNESDNLDGSHIIMSLDEYCENTAKVYAWDNDTQVHLLSHYTCLFIGSSISELTTQRMLHYAKANGNHNNIYYLSGKPTKDEKVFSDRCDRIRKNLSTLKVHYYNTCGLTNVICPKGFNQLFRDVNTLISDYADSLLTNWYKKNS